MLAAKPKQKAVPGVAKSATKPALPKKTESAPNTGRANLSKTTTTATVSTTGKPPANRLSTSKPTSASSATSKKTLPPTKSSSKLVADQTADEKSKIITKRDPKSSISKPGVSKSSADNAAKLPKSTEAQKHLASTDRAAVSVDAAASSVDLLANVELLTNEPAPVIEQTQDIESTEAKCATTKQQVQIEETDQTKINDNLKDSTKDESATEWPNLSPVKRDHTDQNESSSGMDGHYMEDRNNSIDTNNESGIDADTEGKERKEMNFLISDAKDLIQTPEEDKDIIDSLDKNGDIMTRSFIDDGTISSNPFAGSTEKKQQDDSMNDLNKTHELSDYSADHTDNNQDLDGLTKEADSEVIEKSSVAVEDLMDDIKGLRIETPTTELQVEMNRNGADEYEVEDGEIVDDVTVDYNALSNVEQKNAEKVVEEIFQTELEKVANEEKGEVAEMTEGNAVDEIAGEVAEKEVLENKSSQAAIEDPSKWNLLELPKPVDPNNLPAPGDKKQATSNGKKLNSPQQEKSRLSVSKALSKVTNPVYVEVSYIPAHGNSHYVDTEFFRKIRARHYVLSTEEPSEKLLNAIVEAKETWEDSSLPITIIPTYESDVLTTWFTKNEDLLTKLKINITPAASMSTLTMDDNPDLTCQLYKLEF